MGQVIPRQHPAVVLKSHYKTIRALLAAALIAIVALAATVVILANDADKPASSAPISAQAQAAQQQAPGVRFDGGPDEGTRGISTGAGLPPGTRFDGGPDEGSRGGCRRSPTGSRPAPDQLPAHAGRGLQGSRRWPADAADGSPLVPAVPPSDGPSPEGPSSFRQAATVSGFESARLATRSRCSRAEPNSIAFVFARFRKKCRSCSHVKPMPPCTWSDEPHTRQPASEEYAFAPDAAAGRDSGSASAHHPA